MTEPELFDVIELLVDLPKDNLSLGVQGAIVECYDDNNYEVEFNSAEGEAIAVCTISTNTFVLPSMISSLLGSSNRLVESLPEH